LHKTYETQRSGKLDGIHRVRHDAVAQDHLPNPEGSTMTITFKRDNSAWSKDRSFATIDGENPMRSISFARVVVPGLVR
jgi:hypothetical protein